MGDVIRPPSLREVIEAARVSALRSYSVLEHAADPRFDSVCREAANALDAPTASVVFLDREWERVRGSCGADVADAPRHLSFCHHTIHEPSGVLAVPDMLADARFSAHPAVEAGPMHRAYAGASIVDPGEYRIGAIAVLDRKRRQFGPDGLRALQRFAMSIMDMLLSVREPQAAEQVQERPGDHPVSLVPLLSVQGWLGVRTERASAPIEGPPGLRLVSVAHQGPAERAGLVPGDVLYAIADQETRESGDITRALSARHVGEAVPVHVWRGGRAVQCMIHVEAMPTTQRTRRRSAALTGS